MELSDLVNPRWWSHSPRGVCEVRNHRRRVAASTNLQGFLVVVFLSDDGLSSDFCLPLRGGKTIIKLLYTSIFIIVFLSLHDRLCGKPTSDQQTTTTISQRKKD